LKEVFFKAATEILDPDEFLSVLRRDIEKFDNYVLTISPFLNKTMVEKSCNPEKLIKP